MTPTTIDVQTLLNLHTKATAANAAILLLLMGRPLSSKAVETLVGALDCPGHQNRSEGQESALRGILAAHRRMCELTINEIDATEGAR